ncbi:MAG: hypothetical protein ACI865_003409 [Flavobacteriaceae bacterium]|jgi:hypothetical protein
MLKWTTLLWISLINLSAIGQLEIESNEDLMNYLHGGGNAFTSVLDSTEQHRVQFIYTRIDRNEDDTVLTTFDFSNPEHYFYPASVVKLPTALVAMEQMKKHTISMDAYLKIHRDQVCGNMSYIDELDEEQLTMGKMFRELMIISNNRYYNAFYQFVTPAKLNKNLKKKGIENTKIYRSFTGCEMPYNLFCNSLHVTEREKKTSFLQPSSWFSLMEFAQEYEYDETKLLGSKHEYRGDIVKGPFDFNYHLEYPLADIHSTLMRLAAPEQFAKTEQWDITESDRNFFLDAMKQIPSDLEDKKYHDKKKYPDNIFKYLVKGDDNTDYANVVTYSKIGIAYGFVTETAHVVDAENNIEFFVTASIYVNANNIVNDGKYEYDAIARPFFTKLGQLLVDYERLRKK